MLLERKRHEGVGPAICNPDELLLSSYDVDIFFKIQLEKVEKEHPNVIERKLMHMRILVFSDL